MDDTRNHGRTAGREDLSLADCQSGGGDRTVWNEKEEDLSGDDFRLEIENRMKNLLWTVSGDYSISMKPDAALFLRSREIALYEGIRQGAFARYYDKDQVGLYLIKKIFMGAGEKSLTVVSQLCIEEAVMDKICAERPGIPSIARKAFRDILEQEYEEMPSPNDMVSMLRVTVLGERSSGRHLERTKRMEELLKILRRAADARDTMALIRVIDDLYNAAADPLFPVQKGSLEAVLAVTMEDLTEYGWEDYLTEEIYEDALEAYISQLSAQALSVEDQQITREMEDKRKKKHQIITVSPEILKKTYSYVELNYGKTYLSKQEQEQMNRRFCRGIHSGCSLYFTEGILKNPVKRNYQYEYARRLRNKNIYLYHDRYRIVQKNILDLTRLLKKSLVVRSEVYQVLSDRGTVVPSRLWRVGRSREGRLFTRDLKGDAVDFVVDVLIDASGSQMNRQGDVALQGYMIAQALSNAGIPCRVMSYCTFWDYTILHRFRQYDDPASANENIFSYTSSSNNRDGLAVKAAGYGLLSRSEEKKILIVLSDGRPYDVILNRPNSENLTPYYGKEAVSDTAAEIRRLRSQGVSVLGVFAGEESDLAAEKVIFGKDFAYIRDIRGFSRIVGRYLTKHLEADTE